MNKYFTIFNLSWQNEFTYRLNFVLWRFRNILRFLMTFFLWNGIFVTNQNVFGYSQGELLTYVFMVLIVNSIVLSAPSADNIGGEIASGDLSNYLVKPVSYLKYWFMRDLSSKQLNLTFSVFEVILLWLWFRPEIILPINAFQIMGFLAICGVAIVIYYFVNILSKFIAFWAPENTWGLTFLILVAIEIMGGGIFPLDILPAWVQTILQLTPFPYLIYYPVSIFVGKISGVEMILVMVKAFVWALILLAMAKHLWRKGLLVYSSEGR